MSEGFSVLHQQAFGFAGERQVVIVFAADYAFVYFTKRFIYFHHELAGRFDILIAGLAVPFTTMLYFRGGKRKVGMVRVIFVKHVHP